MVIYEKYNDKLVRAYSDQGCYIERDGVLYEDAIDPAELHRVYTETDIPIDHGDAEATAEDYEQALERMGVDLNA